MKRQMKVWKGNHFIDIDPEKYIQLRKLPK
jgi:hypothetical protein